MEEEEEGYRISGCDRKITTPFVLSSSCARHPTTLLTACVLGQIWVAVPSLAHAPPHPRTHPGKIKCRRDIHPAAFFFYNFF
jgi:hypothetical protein